jgi:putative endonuclease
VSPPAGSVASVRDARQHLGAAGEEAAWRLYRRRGFALVARNWRCRIGEMDLIVRRADLLVFCEVKTRRRGTAYGGGWEAVTPRKQAKVRSVAQAFLLATGTGSADVRFDVASVWIGPRSEDVELFEDAF